MSTIRPGGVQVFSIASALVLLMFAGLRVSQALSPRVEETPVAAVRRSEDAVTVETARLDVRPMAPQIEAFGTVRALRSLEIRSAGDGAITEISDSFREGGAVKQGQLLLRVDPDTAARNLREADALLAQARAELNAATSNEPFLKLQVRMAETAVELRKSGAGRKDQLHARQLASRALLDEALVEVAAAEREVVTARQALASGQSRIVRARADVDRAEASREQRAQVLANATITAPFAGRLADVAATLGRRVPANEKLALLLDMQSLEVAFKVRLAELARLVDTNAPSGLTRAPVMVRLDLQGRMLEVPGWIERAAAKVDTEQGSRTVFARLDVPPGSPLLPGDFVAVTVSEPTLAHVAQVPDSAIGENGSLLIVDAGNRLEEAAVTIVQRQGGNLIVRGVPAGAEFVVTRSPVLRRGTLVAPRRRTADGQTAGRG